MPSSVEDCQRREGSSNLANFLELLEPDHLGGFGCHGGAPANNNRFERRSKKQRALFALAATANTVVVTRKKARLRGYPPTERKRSVFADTMLCADARRQTSLHFACGSAKANKSRTCRRWWRSAHGEDHGDVGGDESPAERTSSPHSASTKHNNSPVSPIPRQLPNVTIKVGTCFRTLEPAAAPRSGPSPPPQGTPGNAPVSRPGSRASRAGP